MEEDSRGTPLGNVIRINDERVREHLGRFVRGTVEETLNAMLKAEADGLCKASVFNENLIRAGLALQQTTTSDGIRDEVRRGSASRR
jgi:hypothetical protein